MRSFFLVFNKTFVFFGRKINVFIPEIMDDPDTLVSLFQKIVKSNQKNSIVLEDKKRCWTLSEVNILTDRLAKHFIKEFNTKKGSCVAIYMNKCAEYVFAYIAALKAGEFFKQKMARKVLNFC